MHTRYQGYNPAAAINWLSGIAVTVLIAAGSILLTQIQQITATGLGTLTLAIIAGMIIGNLLPARISEHCTAGINFSKHYLLRGGIILYGFNLTFQQIGTIGYQGLFADLIMLSSTFFLTCLAGICWLKLDRQTVWLIGAGSSICGAAAVLATGPVIRAGANHTAVAIGTVVIFGSSAIIIYPLLWNLIHPLYPALTAAQFGIYTGSTVHEVAQVVAAGHSISTEAENSAVIAKMLRVMMLAPFLLLLSQWLTGTLPQHAGPQGKIRFPWFALLFMLVAGINSFHLLPQPVLQLIHHTDNLMLAMAMAALGLTTRTRQLRQAGLKPMLLGLLIFIWLIIGGAAVNLLLWHVMK
ncbi:MULTISPECIES: YeiH family protein [Tatumella]|uniref:YeiH family protein n=1 Tax=Tatumella punctata TaxID=399969 RepID=A0ABW1VL38_9GAMM|nr:MULTISPECIES: YeiH family protein [unclassified Tatumella]MBS0876491.1 YeiH family putative sulfate export transporter [Tatumella sp. JGM82]MBS0889664.1 YeiH family putative sulfate export transporter [Tatumella sp. JGM94]MBS0892978.1 YeiH family putative sulfate export transporter [Tatumella sp. JGM130]MBS0900786.1 YeiH family putative sulfate export transporter [Tatumella sp. JGM100]